MERATIFFNVDKKITPLLAFPLSPFVPCCQTPATTAPARAATTSFLMFFMVMTSIFFMSMCNGFCHRRLFLMTVS